VVAKIFII